MEYHADRFTDHSLLVYERERLRAVLPASVVEDTVSSHGGLTYGGVVCTSDMGTPFMLEIFAQLRAFLESAGVRKLVYKPVPHIYHRVPAEEDLYALFRQGAQLVRRDVSSTIAMDGRIPYSKGRKWSVKKARGLGLEVARSFDFACFMALEEDNLGRKYGVKPTHSPQEIELLADRFAENIKLFTAAKEGTVLAGVIVYEASNVAHAQYIAATDEGRELGAPDLVLDFLITEYYTDKRYFDFGISTEQAGRYLNIGLTQNKESYGASATVYDTYEWDIVR